MSKNPPYNPYSTYLKRLYNQRVQKITVRAGLSCPNRDGTVGIHGCSYCNNESFAPPKRLLGLSITEQINHGIRISKRRYKKVSRYLVYFQSFSNTHAPLDQLKKLYLEALSHPLVTGLSIGTRPDCIDEEKIDFIASLAREHDITIEYGMESISDETLVRINRGHNYQSFLNAVKLTKTKGIKVCAHLIFGFPWDSSSQHIKTAKEISRLKIDFVKIHQLHIVKNTPLADEYTKRPFKIISQGEYMKLLVEFLEHLDPLVVIQRPYGEAPKDLLLSPSWDIEMCQFNDLLSKLMENQKTFQGRLFN